LFYNAAGPQDTIQPGLFLYKIVREPAAPIARGFSPGFYKMTASFVLALAKPYFGLKPEFQKKDISGVPGLKPRGYLTG
jgi:hypothetical protein